MTVYGFSLKCHANICSSFVLTGFVASGPHKSKLVRKIRLTKAPETLEELYNELRQKFELVGEFCIQYEDSDFGQAVCNLIDIAELPSEKAVLHILWRQ